MRRRDESGFALLLVFVLAAGIAIGLMMQLRRVAFETARDREEMLIERGEQYKRAIALYYRKTNRLPSKLEDLESTNNVRFLRRRYIDPMTGKDEWRIIHAGPGGVLTDSMIKKTPTATGPDGKPLQGGQTGQNAQNFGMNPGNTVGSSGGTFGTSTTSGTGTSGTGDGTEPVEVNAAVLRRPSDRGTGGIPTNTGPTSSDPNQTNDTSQTAYQTQQQPIYPGQPGYPQPGTAGYTGQPIYPGQAGYPTSGTQQQSASQTGQPIYPGQPGYPQPGTAGYTGQPIYPGQAGYPTTGTQQQTYNPMQNMPGVINPQQTGTMNQPGMPQLPGQQPAYNPNNPNVATSPPGSAVGMINDLLRSPRTPPSGAGSAFNNSGMQGGMAGVASNFKGPSIKIYKERKKYQEWEFVYDIKEDPYLKQKNTGSGAGLGNVNPGNTGITNQTGSGSSFNNGSNTGIRQQ